MSRGGSGEKLLDRAAWQLGRFRVPAHQFQNGRDEAQAVVRFLNFEMLWNAGIGAAREQQDGMRRRPQERAVISSRIEIADVEIPMVVGEDQEIGFGQLAAAMRETSEQIRVR